MKCVIPESVVEWLSHHSVHRRRHRFSGFACGWIALVCVLSLTLIGCSQSSTQPSGHGVAGDSAPKNVGPNSEVRPGGSSDAKSTANLINKVKAEVISIAPFTGEKVRLILKVTNVSKQDIVRAKALITVQDVNGNSLGSKSTYLIHGDKGGLAVGGSLEEDAIVEVSDKTKAVGMTFEMEDIRFKERKQ